MSQGCSVYRRDRIGSFAKAADLLSRLRKMHGCMRAVGYLDETGVISIWQEWISVRASMEFWHLLGTEDGTPNLQKPELRGQ